MGSDKVKVFRGGTFRPEGPGRLKRMDNKPYGLELILDLKGCDLSDLSRERLRDYFVRLCELIQMKRHGEPVFWEDHSGLPHLEGISAVQFIETSNVVCHALPLLQAVYLNIFSCREFDTEAAKRFSAAFWGPESIVFTVVTRT
jgi:S-adenosylmethionine decarboxylase